MFTTDIDIVSIVFFGVAIASSIALLLLVLPGLRRVRRATRQAAPELQTAVPVSIIVLSDDGFNLSTYLPQLLSQDYPAPYEVIVVESGSSEKAADIVGRLQQEYSNLYMTYVPRQSRNLSRRKLAITLGIKASGNDCLVITGGNCRIDSPQWLSSIAGPFAGGKEVVVGYSYPAKYKEDGTISYPVKGRGSRYMSYDLGRDSVMWLDRALRGRPLRGDRNCVAFSRKLFFSRTGFAQTLNYVNGDDDLFIEEIATRSNSECVINEGSMTATLSTDPVDAYGVERCERAFTRRRLRRGPFVVNALQSVAVWMWLGFSVASILTGLPSLYPLIAVTAISIGMWIPLMISWRKTMGTLRLRGAFVTLPWMMLTRPMRTLLWRLRSRKRCVHYCWQGF